MTLKQVSKLTGLSEELLRFMRARESITLQSGPPFCKTIDAFGNTKYVYTKADVMAWMKRRKFRITALDAAKILGISRYELLGVYGHGVKSWDSRKGKLVINAKKNIYMWYPKLTIKAA